MVQYLRAVFRSMPVFCAAWNRLMPSANRRSNFRMCTSVILAIASSFLSEACDRLPGSTAGDL